MLTYWVSYFNNKMNKIVHSCVHLTFNRRFLERKFVLVHIYNFYNCYSQEKINSKIIWVHFHKFSNILWISFFLFSFSENQRHSLRIPSWSSDMRLTCPACACVCCMLNPTYSVRNVSSVCRARRWHANKKHICQACMYACKNVNMEVVCLLVCVPLWWCVQGARVNLSCLMSNSMWESRRFAWERECVCTPVPVEANQGGELCEECCACLHVSV